MMRGAISGEFLRQRSGQMDGKRHGILPRSQKLRGLQGAKPLKNNPHPSPPPPGGREFGDDRLGRGFERRIPFSSVRQASIATLLEKSNRITTMAACTRSSKLMNSSLG
jgi:hypothetical protein